MEESKAINKLGEIADLVGMVEDMLNPQTQERLSQFAWSGIRITLRNIREQLQTSQSALAAEVLARARVSTTNSANAAGGHNASAQALAQSRAAAPQSETPRTQILRRDLRAQLEKVMDSSQ